MWFNSSKIFFMYIYIHTYIHKARICMFEEFCIKSKKFPHFQVLIFLFLKKMISPTMLEIAKFGKKVTSNFRIKLKINFYKMAIILIMVIFWTNNLQKQPFAWIQKNWYFIHIALTTSIFLKYNTLKYLYSCFGQFYL